MDVTIVGAGNVGGALAKTITGAGHPVVVTAASRESAERVAGETGAKAVESNREAVALGEAVILAVPTSALDEVLDEIAGELDGKIVIDPTNRADPGDPGSVLDGSSNAEKIQARAPGAHVFKAFNTVFAGYQANPVADGVQVDGFVAGDHADAKAAVLGLVEAIGMRPIDAGPLVMARVLEGMASLNITLTIRNDWSWQTAWKLIGPLS